ncbi:molybdate ABC transporter substrate-binding protein [Aquimarina sp. MMG016]|uniref:molybdate ABC transporter substrate-binding protein n=1 Tax=Aquimarina sp. MMG016 TaxID=2822690 RepID=UPI001B39D384|nr:molybdate ABC transporter substrate-binding protein [Aquimarina sp. MMG016]MBQ4822121.1 molybdate ABC transporter substrate-binding protein [Aquimarina sp. MMG016]
MIKFHLVIIILVAALFSACQQESSDHITIATAANMQFAIKELTKTFATQTGIDCDLVISSSGKLTAQIKEGAPYDIFISADMRYPKKVYDSGFSMNPPKIYAYGRLVLWTAQDTIQLSMNTLRDPNINHIAIANPKTAPYGKAAIEVLQQWNIYDTIKDKLVYGESIAQVNQFVMSKSAEVGFTAESVILAPEIKEKGHWMKVGEAGHQPIIQGVVLIDHEDAHPEAIKFYEFLFSAKAKEILEDFGYLVPEHN